MNDLQPAQKTDALAEIARVWRDAGRMDEALAAARELIAASPANAASYLLEADLLLASDHPEEGLSRLREAVKLSEKPNEVRLRLARAQADLGHNADAQTTLDEAFEAAADAHERLSLMKPLADAYQRENRLDELIGRFQHLQQAEADGWRYALYLAEIYQQTLDFGAARRELAKALAARPKDGALLRQLVRLATEEQNTAEVARYQAQLAEAEPSDTNKFALVEALLGNNQATEGFNALRANLTAVLKTPGAWDRLLPLLASNNLTTQAGELLARETGGPDADVKARFTLALFQAMAGNLGEAKTAFWSVFAARSPRAAAPPAAPASPATGKNGFLMSIYTGDSIAEQRFRDGSQARYMAQQFLTAGGARMGRFRIYNNATGVTQPNAPSATDTARDTALLYLAAIAVKENAPGPFLAEMDRQLAARDSSREDRMVADALVDAVDAELREIAAQVERPEPGLDAFSLSRLVMRATMNNPSYRQYSSTPEITEAQAAAMEPLFDRLLARTHPAAATAEAGETDMMRFAFLRGLGRKDQAETLRRKLLAGTDEKSSHDRLESNLQLLLEGDFSAPDRAQIKTVCRALVEGETKSATPAGQYNQSYYYPISVFQSDSQASKLAPAEFAEVEAALIGLWYPAAPPPPAGAGLGASNPYGYRSNGNSAREDTFLPPTRYLDSNHVSVLQQLSQYMSQGGTGRLQAIGVELDRQAKELPAPRRIYPRLVATYLLAWGGDNAGALAASQSMLAEQPDDNDLRLLTGVLLGRNDKRAEAVATLNGVNNARYGEAAVILQQQLLVNAKAAKDTETARRAALKLVSLRLDPQDRTALIEDLRALGVNDKAEQLARTTVPTRGGGGFSGRVPSIFDYETANNLQTLVSAKNTDGALNLIRGVFAAMPPSASASSNNAEYVIREAISTLRKLNKLDEFIAAAEKQLAKDPDSLSLNYQLAVLHQDENQQGTEEKRAAAMVRTPVWMKLARADEEIVGSYSTDGETWKEVGRARVALGTEPLAALAAASSQTKPAAPNVVADHVALLPSPSDGSSSTVAGGPALPAPWTETLLPVHGGKSDDVPPSVWQDGVFTLHAAGWDLWGRYDDVRLVHRPLGGATEFTARMTSVEGPKAETKAGVMWRADLTGDSPYAAMLFLPGGAITFQHRDHSYDATPYWRKLATLQPKETRYGRALARSLAARGERMEAIALYDKLIAANPDETLSESNDLSSVYGDERIIDLADRLLAWKSSPNASGVSHSYPSYSFYPVANACVEQKQPEKAIALCRRGIELDNAMGGGNTNVNLFDLLVKTLVAEKRPDEARDVLVACYVPPLASGAGKPPGGGGSSAPQLGFRSNTANRFQNGPNWMWSISWSSDEIRLYQLELLEAANKAGLLEGLQKALEQRRTDDPTAFTEGALDWLLVLVQLDRQDPAVLADLPALLAKPPAANINYGNNEQAQVAVRMEVAKRLRQWPGHEALALEAFRAAGKLAAGTARQYGPYPLSNMVSLQQARLELELGDAASATSTLRDLAGRLTAPGSASRNEADTRRQCLNLLLRAGPAADPVYLDLYAHTTDNTQGRRDLYFAYGLEKSQRTGDNPHFQPMAWLLDDGGDTPDATLVYELRVSHPYDKGGLGAYPGSRGRSFPGSEGERTLTFSYGPDADHFAPIGQLKTTSTFGTWTGPVPPGSGVLKVTIDAPRPADAAALAAEEAAKTAKTAASTPAPSAAVAPARGPGDYYLRVVRAPNLITNPTFEGLPNRDTKAETFSLPGWPDLPAGFWKQNTLDNPRPGRPYVQCDLSRQQEYTITGARIAVEPGHAFFQSAWLRDTGDGSGVHLGRRYLDADGNVLKTSECPDFSTLLWRWHSQRLQVERGGKDTDGIPPKTAFIEPFIRFQGSVAWTGLFMGKAD